MDDVTFTILMKSVYGLTDEEENKQVNEIINDPMERLVLQNLQEEKLQYNSYENHLAALEQKTESMWSEFQKQLVFSRQKDKTTTIIEDMSFYIDLTNVVLENVNKNVEKQSAIIKYLQKFENVSVSRKAAFFNNKNLKIGVRISKSSFSLDELKGLFDYLSKQSNNLDIYIDDEKVINQSELLSELQNLSQKFIKIIFS